MNRNLHSPTKLTEFARDFEQEPETLLTKFVNKLTNVYNSGYNTVNIAPQQSAQPQSSAFASGSDMHSSVNTPMIFSRTCSANSLNQLQQTIAEKSSEQLSNNISSSSDSTSPDCSADKTEDTPPELPEERTHYNVIQRISNLMALRNTNLSSYKNTELQRFWMPDSKSKECYECSVKFSTFRRKHHCRLCGQIFCSKCCNQVVPGKIINCSGDLKVCTYCSKIVLSYLKSADINSDLKSDLKALQDDLASKLSLNDSINHSLEPPSAQLCRKISVGYQEERLVSMPKTALQNADRKAILQQSNSLKTLHMEMSKSLPNQNRGDQLVSFLIANLKSSNKVQAIAILNAMLEAEFILPIVSNDYVQDMVLIEFDENTYYKLLRLDDVMTQSGSFQLDLNVDTSSVHLTRPARHDGLDDGHMMPSSINQDSSQFGFSTTKEFEMQNSLLSTAASKSLLESFCDHEDLLLTQLLRHECLDQSWAKILLPICARIANSIRPDSCGVDQMDIRNLVNFKKVPGGLRTETKIVGGVVFSKNVVHKDMATFIENPKVLLLRYAIVYQRVEGKFVSIESLFLQEREYLRNVTERILSLRPNVVVVHKNVSGIAQDMLRDHGITLVLDVKMSVLDRLARCLKCDIVTSIDSNIRQPKLGTCDRFYIQGFNDELSSSKALMFFETPSTPRGCCVLLRGGSNAELVKVKRVALMLLFARYNWRLELSFLLDEFARPPSPKSLIFDSKDHSPSKVEVSDDNNATNSPQPHAGDLQQDSNSALKKVTATTVKPDRKTDEKIVNKENVQDFSDPLRAIDLSLSTFDPETSVEFAVETPYDNRFRTALSSTVLSISPFVGFPLPYLETEQGRKCHLRSYYPIELYYSKQWSDNMEKPAPPETVQTCDILADTSMQLNAVHPFVMHKITTSIDNNKELQALWASYKASGGRLQKIDKMKKISTKSSCSVDKHLLAALHNKTDNELLNKDALDFENHQRLPVLFCSYYYNPNAPSSFCAQPSLLNMKFYGQNDIMLGQFLLHYCFKNSYMCPSCHLPTLDHVRRYIHSMGCIQVKLTEDLTSQNVDQILMTSWCSVCHEMTPSVKMSKDTGCLSFGKYLELRFHSHAYKRRVVDINTPSNSSSIEYRSASSDKDTEPSSTESLSTDAEKPHLCSHSLHRDHVQYFSYNGIVASFSYTAIEVWEVVLPCIVLDLRVPRLVDTNLVLEDIKNFALRGYEVYAKFQDKLAELSADVELPTLAFLKQTIATDQSAFRDKVATVQTLLTEKNIKPFDINDAMLIVKKILADSIELLGPHLTAACTQNRTSYPAKPELNSNEIDSGIICTEDLKPESQSASDTPDEFVYAVGSTTPTQVDGGKDLPLNSTDATDAKEKINVDELTPSYNKPILEGQPHRDTANVTDKKSVKTILRELLASDKNVFVLPSPIPPNEHFCLPLGKFPVLVYDNDLSSVIAYTLVSEDYRKALTNMQTGYSSDTGYSPKVKRRSQDGLIDGSSSGPDDKELSSGRESGGVDRKSSGGNKSSMHAELSFQDLTTQFTCKIYFAREFDAMRANYIKPPPKSSFGNVDSTDKNKTLKSMPLDRKSSSNSLTPKGIVDSIGQQESDDIQCAFARSLCESIPWEARGGKSGSKFCKTYDDRFVLKEMSRQDIAIFENFAPNYFIYVNQCLQRNQPTLLAKIFGAFKVTVRKKDSLQEKSLLIMENLFFNCDISNKFDLKGSDRNRLVDPTHQNGEIVLLDENLIQMSWSKPLYVLSHSKAILREAIIRDATFLERNDVMDYSLLVGLNSADRTLVLGVIDYIRTYTLDKKIESIVKQTGILGGQGKLPTVISPKLYKQRFSEAMERYFLTVPDRWEGLAKV